MSRMWDARLVRNSELHLKCNVSSSDLVKNYLWLEDFTCCLNRIENILIIHWHMKIFTLTGKYWEDGFTHWKVEPNNWQLGFKTGKWFTDLFTDLGFPVRMELI